MVDLWNRTADYRLLNDGLFNGTFDISRDLTFDVSVALSNFEVIMFCFTQFWKQRYWLCHSKIISIGRVSLMDDAVILNCYFYLIGLMCVRIQHYENVSADTLYKKGRKREREKGERKRKKKIYTSFSCILQIERK